MAAVRFVHIPGTFPLILGDSLNERKVLLLHSFSFGVCSRHVRLVEEGGHVHFSSSMNGPQSIDPPFFGAASQLRAHLLSQLLDQPVKKRIIKKHAIGRTFDILSTLRFLTDYCFTLPSLALGPAVVIPADSTAPLAVPWHLQQGGVGTSGSSSVPSWSLPPLLRLPC